MSVNSINSFVSERVFVGAGSYTRALRWSYEQPNKRRTGRTVWMLNCRSFDNDPPLQKRGLPTSAFRAS